MQRFFLAFRTGYILKSNPENSEINSLDFESKYKIIEYSYNKFGIKSNYTYSEFSHKLRNESTVGDELFDEANQVNRIAYWIVGLWGSIINIPQKPNQKFNYVKLSDQIWFYDGEQDEINYQEYINILHKMRATNNEFRNWIEFYDNQKNSFIIDFQYNQKNYHWEIDNISGGWMNGIIFKLYTDLCNHEYINEGNYFIVGEGQGGYIMFLEYEAEEYLRTLWNFPKLNKQGKLQYLYDYGEKYESR